MADISVMDESIVSFEQEGILSSSVLVPMGIKINKANPTMRIKEVIGKFNETYLETMDFLTQILPLAREQFGRSDNLLLPKTPSKKRHRKVLQTLRKQEEPSSNVPVVFNEPAPIKQSLRTSSRRNNPTEVDQEQTVTRETRSRKKKSISKVEESKVTFVDENKMPCAVINIVKSSSTNGTNESASASKNLKRTSSTSPASVKPVKKKSKSNDESSLADEENLPEKVLTPVTKQPNEMSTPVENQGDKISQTNHTSTPVSNEPPLDQPSVSLITNELEITSTNEVVIGQAKNEEISCLEDEKMEIESNENNESDTNNLVKVNDRETCSNDGAAEVPSDPPLSKVHVEPKAKILVSDGKSTDQDDATSPIVVINSSLKLNELVSTNNETTDKLILEAGQTSDTERQPLRRSKRLSRQVLQEETSDQSKQIEEPLSKQADGADQDPIKDVLSQDDEPSKQLQSSSPAEKPLRRSTRLSRRVSKVSTGLYNKRKSTRRSSRRSSCFKKPLSIKKVEVSLVDKALSLSKMVPPEIGRTFLDKVKGVALNSEHSCTESEDEGVNDALKVVLEKKGISQWQSSRTDSSSDECVETTEGKVAGIIQQLNRNSLIHNEQPSMLKTPNGLRKIKRIGSISVQGSSHRPSNLVGGNVSSFIKRQSVKKPDANELVRQKKLELQRKEEKDRERKDQAELRRKNWVEEQKRKREEKQKRVTEAKAAREREEQDKKQRQLEEKKQTLQALEQAKKKREHEEETKKKLREQRTREAEARRLKEKEERIKKLQDKEEEEKMYREMLKRKQEHEELERKQRIQEEKRLHEQKQRERQREKEEERERRLRDIREREAKRAEKEEIERKQKEEVERKEKEEKERKQREQEEREKKRIAQLIKDKMEQEKKLYEEKRQNEEKERREREEQSKREAAQRYLLHAKTADSYLMTPPPAQTRKPATEENYDISDIRSDESTDDEDCPRKKVPSWAQGAQLKAALLHQEGPRRVFEELASGFVPHAPDLEKIFTKKRKRFYQRTSSAHWGSPPLKTVV